MRAKYGEEGDEGFRFWSSENFRWEKENGKKVYTTRVVGCNITLGGRGEKRWLGQEGVGRGLD